MKRWIRILCVLVCAAVLCACSEEETVDGNIINMYYIGTAETKIEMRDYVLVAQDADSQVKEVLEALSVMPEKLEYKAPLAMGFVILAYNLENGVLTLDVDAAYRELSFTTEVLVRASLVYSLEQLEDVNYVSITIEGNPLRDRAGSLVGIMNSSMFLNNMGSEISSYDTANLVLYFANEAGDQLIAVNRQKAYNTNISLERLVVEELIAGPSATVEGLCATIDPGTKVISVMTKDGVCYVNVDEAFLSAVSNVTADVTIYSIVNSLVELNHINKVQISVNGDTSGMFREKYSLGTVFERNLDLVTTLSK